jgi:hypothetical protein
MCVVYCDRISRYEMSHQNAPMMGLGVQTTHNMYMDMFETDMVHQVLPDGLW